jgi:hypothetical protein
MGLAILKCDKAEGSSLHYYKDYSMSRDIECEHVLEAGQYIVVPRTTGCGLRRPDNAEAEAIKLMDNAGNFHPDFSATIIDVFNKFDLVVSGTIDFKEFKGFLEIIGKTIKDEKEFNETVANKFVSYKNALTVRGFKEWWRQALLSEGEAQIWQYLEKLGYDHDLYSVRSRLFNVSFHSRCLEGEDPVEVRIRDTVGTDIDNKTNEMIIQKYGEEEASGEGYKVFSHFSNNAFSYSYAVKNETDKPIEATIDLGGSDNMGFSSKGPLIKKTIPAGELEFMIHTQAGFGNFNKVLRHSSKEIVGK